MSGRIPLGSHLALDFCLLGDFWLLIELLCRLWVCSNFLFLPVSLLVVCVFLRIYPFLPDCPVYWYIIFIVFSYHLYCCVVGCDLSTFILDFIYMGPLSFLFGKFCLGCIDFINSFKESALSFVDILFSFVSILSISALIFIISPLLLAFGFIAVPFLNPLDIR